MMNRFCLALDLIDDPVLIAAYEEMHKQVWPEIQESIRTAGILRMEIYRVANRLMMIIEAGPEFNFEKKAVQDLANPKVQEWEQLMWKYQQSLPASKPGEKWVEMNLIFQLENS